MATTIIEAYVDGSANHRLRASISAGVILWPDGVQQRFKEVCISRVNPVHAELSALARCIEEAREGCVARVLVDACLIVHTDNKPISEGCQCLSARCRQHIKHNHSWKRLRAAITAFPGEVVVRWIPRAENRYADLMASGWRRERV